MEYALMEIAVVFLVIRANFVSQQPVKMIVRAMVSATIQYAIVFQVFVGPIVQKQNANVLMEVFSRIMRVFVQKVLGEVLAKMKHVKI